jgi:hypothetical protein
MAHPLTHLTHGIPTRRPFHPAKIELVCAANAARTRLAVSITRWPTNRFTASNKPHAFKSLLAQPCFC